MKDMDQILKGKVKDFEFIGERLKLIRKELSDSDDTVEDRRKSKFSRKNMCERLEIDYSTITNVERGTLSLTSIKLILFYYSLGYNPMWIMSPDNEFIPKHNVGENVVYQLDVQDQYKEMESSIVTALSAFKDKL